MTPMILRTLALSLGIALALPAGGAAANNLPSLRENKRVNDELFAAAVGDQIRRNCPSVHARMFYVLRKARELEAYAMSLGYTKAQIDAYVESDEEKARMRERRDRYLAENGVVRGDAESYCRLGRREIENRTFIGSLLWTR